MFVVRSYFIFVLFVFSGTQLSFLSGALYIPFRIRVSLFSSLFFFVFFIRAVKRNGEEETLNAIDLILRV